MRKRSLSTQALSIQDWMKYRPYERFSNYDGYYLKQANAIFNLLNHPTEGFRKYFKREHLLELAILITCHFEDFINDIGLWKALVRKHRELYGYPIPFYKPEGYDRAMTAPDWLAEVARCTDEVRPKIRRLFQRVSGTFLYDGCDDHYYHFRFIRSNRLFHIRRESVNLETDDMRTGVEAGVFGIVNWCGEWWLSGTYMGWELSAKDIEKIRLDPKAVNFYGWTDAEQQLIRDRTAEMESAFIEYFGDRLVVFPNQKAMAAAMEAQQTFWNKKKVQKSAPATAKSKLAKQVATQYTGFKDLNFGDRNSVAAYFIPGEGVFMSPVVPELIRRLQADKLSTEESDELFYTLFKECTPPLARLLVERYTGKNLIFPQMDNPDFVAQHFEFFLHYYNPGDFREVVPNLSLAGEREASHTEEVETKK